MSVERGSVTAPAHAYAVLQLSQFQRSWSFRSMHGYVHRGPNGQSFESSGHELEERRLVFPEDMNRGLGRILQPW